MTFKWLDDVKLDYLMRYVISLEDCVCAASVRAKQANVAPDDSGLRLAVF